LLLPLLGGNIFELVMMFGLAYAYDITPFSTIFQLYRGGQFNYIL
jgi:hypothetical protein